MKRILTLCLIFTAVLLTGCKKETITTTYTIGCIGYNTSSASDWTGFEEYMSSVTTYNQLVSFINTSLAENDTEAAEFFNAEVAKVNTATACSFIGNEDYLVYGIARQAADGEITTIQSVTFTSNGILNE